MKLIRDGWLLANMEESVGEVMGAYLPKEQAYEIAKRWTGQDFGLNTDAWRAWFAANGENLSNESLSDALWAVMGPPKKEDPEELKRQDAEMEELKRRWAKLNSK